MNSLLLIALTMLLTACAAAPQVVDEDVEVQRYWPAPPITPRFRHEATLRSSEDFIEKSSEQLMREKILGKPRPQFVVNRPLDIAARQGRLYLVDGDRPVVHVIDLVRRRYFAFGYRFEGKLANPVSIAAGPQGEVFVADRDRNSVIVYDGIGLFRRAIALQGVTTQLAGLAVDHAGEFLYVVDRGGIDSRQHQLIKLTTKGELVERFGRRGKATGEFNLPMDVAIDRDNRLFVLDTGNFRVQVLDANGNWLRSWGEAGSGLGQFGLPRSIAIDADNHVYISDAQFGNVQIFNEQGRLLLPIGELSADDRPGRYALITGIGLDSLNHLYVLDQHMSKIEVFRKLSAEQGQQALREHQQANPN